MKKDDINDLFLGGMSILQVYGCIQQEKVMVAIHPRCKHTYINVYLTHRLQVPTNNICSTQVDGEHAQVFKDLKITMDKYALHYDFHAIDMDNADIVLGYPWMNSVGTINLNVDNKFLKLWYKKKKVTLQDISLTTQEEPQGAPIGTYTWNLVVIHLDALDHESVVVDTIDDTTSQADMPKNGHYNENNLKWK